MGKRIRALPDAELRAILRAADDLIGQAGRSMLANILKGSRNKKLLELGLERNPSYGFYQDLSLEQVMAKVDHMIKTDFLEIQYSGKLPMIVSTPRGWALERERRAEEFLQEWDNWIANGVVPVSMEYLKERNRGMILLILYKVLCTGDPKYIPFLAIWERTAFKKVQAEIRKVADALSRRHEMEHAEWERVTKEQAASLIVRLEDPIFQVCHRCGELFIFDEENPAHYTREAGLRFPDWCPECVEGKG
ncbi:RQC domain-containing protein [Paenibacillus cymbidii]|uniref:RQC domain-containing protein n=1 Tax=Paenibacillus cymbidii TaxID=1639034 RepID=UPI00107FE3A5|nr:RQC-minor-1 family DNA-binding protein [Paenibacillus cymbidii]